MSRLVPQVFKCEDCGALVCAKDKRLTDLLSGMHAGEAGTVCLSCYESALKDRQLFEEEQDRALKRARM